MMTESDVPAADEIVDKSSDNQQDPIDMIDQLITELPVEKIPLSLLENGLFLRGAGTDTAHVKLLADAAGSSELPPILVQKGNYRIVDGMHRVEAARLRGEKSIKAQLIPCTDQDAFILALKTNTLHGLPLSRRDRIFGAKHILAWHPDWSDRGVAAATGLGAKTIAGLRHHSADGIQQFSKRVGRDGKRHPLTAAEGRRRAVEYMMARPDAPLRQVAREVDVSLATAQDVRTRMRRGTDPITVGRQRPSPKPAARPLAEDGASLRNVANTHGIRPSSPDPSWGLISAKLATDPSLRYTEGGRKFFRWMSMYATHASEWNEFSDAIPSHWLKDVYVAVNETLDELHHFADELRRRQNQAKLTPAIKPTAMEKELREVTR
jgi:ParB-like nuclease domain